MNLQRPLYDYDRCINSTLAMIKSNLSDDNARLLVKYHKVMMTSGLAKAIQLRSLPLGLALGDPTQESSCFSFLSGVFKLFYHMI